MVFLIVFAVVSMGASAINLQWPLLALRSEVALLILGPSVLIYGSLQFASWVCWDRWIKRLGMQCPSCQHYLFGHKLGDRNPATGGCIKCEESVTGHCGNIGETELCDNCGQRVLDL